MSDFHGSKTTLLDTVAQFFIESGWHYERADGQDAISLRVQSGQATARCLASTIEETERFQFRSSIETTIPDESRTAVMEYLTRANHGLVLGNFEMNLDRGEVLYRTSTTVEGSKLSVEMVRTLVHVNLLMIQKYFPGLMAVAFGGKAPTTAIEEAEREKS